MVNTNTPPEYEFSNKKYLFLVLNILHTEIFTDTNIRQRRYISAHEWGIIRVFSILIIFLKYNQLNITTIIK